MLLWGDLIYMNKTKTKNLVFSVFISVLTVIVSIVLMRTNIIDVNKLMSSVNNFEYDFQFNLIQTSAIIAGFLFSGVSILISAIDKKRIQRLWDYNYLDNLYVFAFEGMIANLISILCAICILIVSLHDKARVVCIYIEMISLILGFVSFIICIKYLISIILRLKNSNKDE